MPGGAVPCPKHHVNGTEHGESGRSGAGPFPYAAAPCPALGSGTRRTPLLGKGHGWDSAAWERARKRKFSSGRGTEEAPLLGKGHGRGDVPCPSPGKPRPWCSALLRSQTTHPALLRHAQLAIETLTVRQSTDPLITYSSYSSAPWAPGLLQECRNTILFALSGNTNHIPWLTFKIY